MRVITSSIALWALSAGMAFAGQVEDDVAAAAKALAGGQVDAAVEALDAAEQHAEEATTLVGARTLARYWLYRGVVFHLQQDKKGRSMESWRQALVVDNELAWEEEVLDEGDPHSLFEALRGEVKGRARMDTGVPEKVGAARFYVSGQEVKAGDVVLSATHLAQIRCDDGKYRGAWSDLSKPVKWFKLCPGGVDTSVVVVEEAESEDEFAEFGPMFGGSEDGEDTGGSSVDEAPTPAEPAPVAAKEAVEEPAQEAAADEVEDKRAKKGKKGEPVVEAEAAGETEDEAVEDEEVLDLEEYTEKRRGPEGRKASPRSEGAVSRVEGGGVPPSTWLYAGTGALGLGAGGVYVALLSPIHQDISAARLSPSSVTRAEADALTSTYNRNRLLFFGLGAGAVGTLTGALFMDADIRPVIGPGHLGVAGWF